MWPSEVCLYIRVITLSLIPESEGIRDSFHSFKACLPNKSNSTAVIRLITGTSLANVSLWFPYIGGSSLHQLINVLDDCLLRQ